MNVGVREKEVIVVTDEKFFFKEILSNSIWIDVLHDKTRE